MKFNNFSSTPGRVMVHIGLVLVQWFKRSPCGPVMKLPLLPSAASPATPRHGGPSIPPGTAFQAPHCAQTGKPRCPAATTRDWPPGTMVGGTS